MSNHYFELFWKCFDFQNKLVILVNCVYSASNQLEKQQQNKIYAVHKWKLSGQRVQTISKFILTGVTFREKKEENVRATSQTHFKASPIAKLLYSCSQKKRLKNSISLETLLKWCWFVKGWFSL